jgi:hypothetical protein
LFSRVFELPLPLPRSAQKRTKKKKKRHVRTFFRELAQMYVVFSFYFFCRPLLLLALALGGGTRHLGYGAWSSERDCWGQLFGGTANRRVMGYANPSCSWQLALARGAQGGGGDFSAAEIATADVVYEIARGQRMRKK